MRLGHLTQLLTYEWDIQVLCTIKKSPISFELGKVPPESSKLGRKETPEKVTQLPLDQAKQNIFKKMQIVRWHKDITLNFAYESYA